MAIDMSWVLPSLAVGARLPDDCAIELAHTHRIRRVVDVRHEARDPDELIERGIALLHLPTFDQCAIAPAMLEAGVAFVREGLHRDERVLVHCNAGVGRSVLLVCCVLVCEGDTPRRALERVKAARAPACPSPEQLEALVDFSEAWDRAQGRTPSTLAWSDLAVVVYSR
jgi:protein-tyrosine phosphatase